MAFVCHVIETSDNPEEQASAVQTYLNGVSPVSGTLRIAVDGGLHRCRIYLVYETS